MHITIHSSRFGELEVAPEAVLEFPSGLIGVGGSRYALLARDAGSAFVWLHSLEDPDLAIPVCDPWQFFPEYEVELADEEAERVGIHDPAEAEVWVTVRAAEALEGFSANLRAPILISRGRGHQVINQSHDAPLRAPLFDVAHDPQPAGAPA